MELYGNSIISVFEKIVSLYPDNRAIWDQGLSIAYKELNQKANQFAHFLSAQGVQKGDIIASTIPRSADAIIAYIGILKAGAVYLPIERSYPEERKEWMKNDANPKLLIEALPELAAYSTQNLPNSLSPTDAAYINYTSGSTGSPKGVLVPHRGALRLVLDAEWLGIGPDDRFLHISNISFDASTGEIWGALLNGAALCIYPPEPICLQKLEQILSQEKVTHCDLPVKLFNTMVDTRLDLFKGIKRVFVGGDVMSARHANALRQAFPSCALFNTYGPTENTTLTTVYEIKDPILHSVPIGKPINQTTVYILDGSLKPVERGELYTGGAGVALGYLNRPDLTAEKFIPNPFGSGLLYRTGDIVSQLPCGNLVFHGRVDNQVKIRGFRVELSEVEHALRSHPSVADSLVLAKDDQLIAYIEPKQGQSVEEIESFIRSRLPAYMIPSHFIPIDRFPVCPHGKIDRKALPSPEKARQKRSAAPPLTPAEKAIASHWEEILAIAPIGRTDDFFQLGGDSLDAVELIARVTDLFAISLPIHALSEYPTLQAFARRCEQIEAEQIPFSQWRDQEAVLDPAIIPQGQPNPAQYTDPKSILLTGATGFIGAFFLAELLEQTDAKIYCLVRKDTVQQNLTRYRLWKSHYAARIVIVEGDLEKPRLGTSQYAFLTQEIDAIFHFGAKVNHALPYIALKPANVLGTHEILRLAAEGRPKPVHHISTVDVFEEGGIKGEDFNLDDSRNLTTGYAQSKWVGEKLALLARARGLSVNIYRVGSTLGHAESGTGTTDDQMWRLIQGCLQLKKHPETQAQVEFLPVDILCQMVHYLSAQPKQANQTFHTVNTEKVSYMEIFGYLKKLGYTLSTVEYADFNRTLVDLALKTKEPSLRALAALFPVVDPTPGHLGNKRLVQALKDSPLHFPKIDGKLFKKYIDYYTHIGFLPSIDLQAI